MSAPFPAIAREQCYHGPAINDYALSRARGYVRRALRWSNDIIPYDRVLNGIDVYRLPERMVGKTVGAPNATRVEAACIVGRHGLVIVTLKVANWLHREYGEAKIDEFCENFRKRGRNRLSCHEVSLVQLSVETNKGQ